jgi:hypothetical protein
MIPSDPPARGQRNDARRMRRPCRCSLMPELVASRDLALRLGVIVPETSLVRCCRQHLLGYKRNLARNRREGENTGLTLLRSCNLALLGSCQREA